RFKSILCHIGNASRIGTTMKTASRVKGAQTRFPVRIGKSRAESWIRRETSQFAQEQGDELSSVWCAASVGAQSTASASSSETATTMFPHDDAMAWWISGQINLIE